MKLKDSFIPMELEDELFLVPTGEATQSVHGIIRFNETASFIVKCLQKETTLAQIVDALLQAYTVERPEAENHVRILLGKLREIGAVEE